MKDSKSWIKKQRFQKRKKQNKLKVTKNGLLAKKSSKAVENIKIIKQKRETHKNNQNV